MVELLSQKNINKLPSSSELLYEDEFIVIVDDSPEIVLLLENYLSRHDIPVLKAHDADQLYDCFLSHKIALVLLDIGLPGKSGTEILSELVPKYPDLGIIMVTGSLDIEIALDCLRRGADDYLTKPLLPNDFNRTLIQTLRKRKLAIENRIFQRELEATNARMHFLHTLNLKMNTAYLSALELDSVLHAILTGITSEGGLQFNRAFLALYEGSQLVGKLAIGPSSKENAREVWENIKNNRLNLHTILDTILSEGIEKDNEVTALIRTLTIPLEDKDHILIYASQKRASILVESGVADGCKVPDELLNLLGERDFVVVPLFSPSQSLGVIIADNFVTGNQITDDDVTALEIFANQASLAIEHTHLYQDMMAKIKELELVTQELEKNKDMLIEAERHSTMGYISAQLVHAIRNPITSIGATARLLLKRAENEKSYKFLQVIAEESEKIETTLQDIFNFVGNISLNVKKQSIKNIVSESLATFYPSFKNQNIELKSFLPDDDFMLTIDATNIRKVLMHLIRNSVEAMGSGGVLEVHLYENDKGTTIEIIDSGSGVSETNIDQVNDPFFTTKTYGTGLGLSLVEQILDLHGADFSLKQQPQGGMKAAIFFPSS